MSGRSTTEGAREPVDLATMAIADKVSRFVHARYYAAHLHALQSAAEQCGGSFVAQAALGPIPPDVEEHLAIAVLVAREAYLAPWESLADHYATAQRRMSDGFAQALLRDFLAALQALGLQFELSPSGVDREAIKTQREEWQSAISDKRVSLVVEPRVIPSAPVDSLEPFVAALRKANS